MIKRIMMVAFVFGVMFSFGSTTTLAQENFTANPNMHFENESFESLPVDIQKNIDKLNENGFFNQSGATLLHSGMKTYVVITLGFRNSTGYGIEVNQVQVKNSKLVVHATETTPEPDAFVGMAITNPMMIISVQDAEHRLTDLSFLLN